jgi:hypothetical protein
VLAWTLLAVVTARPARAQDSPPKSPAPAPASTGSSADKPAQSAPPDASSTKADPAAPPDASSTKAELPAEPPPAGPPKGYIPGSRRAIGLGLSPHAPEGPSLPGGATIPFSAPEAESNDFNFKFSGFMSAALRLSAGARDNATPQQFTTSLVGLPRIPDIYGAVQGTNAPQGSWVELRFDYGNANVKSVVKLSTWAPIAGETYSINGSQNWVNEAFLVFTWPASSDLSVFWTVGAFRNIYGALGQYGAGQYNAAIIGMPFGIGETLSAKYKLSSTFTLVAEDGLMGRFSKVPIGGGPTIYNQDADPSFPSSFVHHAHLGLAIEGEVPFQLGLHYLSNFAQDERDQIPDPKDLFINWNKRPDPSMTVLGADFRMLNNYLGNFALAVSYADASYAQLLTGMSYYGSDTGEILTQRLLGEQGGGTGKLLISGFEYNFSLAKLLWHPEAYWGEGPDLVMSAFANVAANLESADPNFTGRKLWKAGAEATYRFAPWIAISCRYDHVAPNSRDLKESFDVVSPKLVLRSNWNSHEQVSLSYTRWFYGADTHGEAPIDWTHQQLDTQMFALTFGMWW